MYVLSSYLYYYGNIPYDDLNGPGPGGWPAVGGCGVMNPWLQSRIAQMGPHEGSCLSGGGNNIQDGGGDGDGKAMATTILLRK
jgi:hypothetical protein